MKMKAGGVGDRVYDTRWSDVNVHKALLRTVVTEGRFYCIKQCITQVTDFTLHTDDLPTTGCAMRWKLTAPCNGNTADST